MVEMIRGLGHEVKSHSSTVGPEVYEEVKKKINKYINKRCQDIILAQRENPRRLSVSYTNLGIIQKHQNNIDGAMKSFNKALDLWDKNLSAENNINIIQGKPLKEQSILERIFPDKK